MFAKDKKKKNRLVLLDAHAILHRGYHALPNFSSPKGEPTGALYGLSAILIKLIGDLNPDYIVACFDMPGPTFRHEAFEEYKATRPAPEDDLIQQMNRARDIFRSFNIPIYQQEGFEADDIIATVVSQSNEKLEDGKLEIIIASGDMDTLQLVDDKRVTVYTLKKGLSDTVLYDESAVKKRFGFSPKLLPDFKGLRGDPSDNIPGVPGIGEKTASSLIQAFGSLEEIYRQLKKNPEAFEKKGFKQRIVNLLKENEEESFFSKELALVRVDVPIVFSVPDRSWNEAVKEEVIGNLFRELGFRTLLERVRKVIAPVDAEPASETLLKREKDGGDETQKVGIGLWLLDSNITNPSLSDILHATETKTISEAKEKINRKLKEQGLWRLYHDIELPLLPILKKAQERGILVDPSQFDFLAKTYRTKLAKLQKSIWKLAGGEFNINSPKQLGEVLFDRLDLQTKGLKKTEGGARSTRESELLKLQGMHPIIDLILSYRETQKLFSTYIEPIPRLADKNNRLHTTFIQTGTTTGRMSSVNPNLQNIPIKGETGKQVRKGFIAGSGYQLAAFDYSQIELRVLAMLSGDETLIKVFERGHDAHASVAAEIFGISESEVTADMRRRAKAVNFGIVYGMGVNSLRKALGSSLAEARLFYENYFREFPKVAEYLASVKKEAAQNGYTKTLFGRRRYFDGIESNIPYIKSAAERMAINAPIQGTATGDIIKGAIVLVDKILRKNGLSKKAFLLLQVHDELVYEINEDSVSGAVPLIKDAMENVLGSYEFDRSLFHPVSLVVDASVGDNWGGMKKI